MEVLECVGFQDMFRMATYFWWHLESITTTTGVTPVTMSEITSFRFSGYGDWYGGGTVHQYIFRPVTDTMALWCQTAMGKVL